jgi:glycosyltransferase involved in cell wall biosynthesis
MSLRIGVVVPSLSGGGAEFVARTWAEWLRTQGHVVAMVLTNGPDGTRPPPVDVAVIGLDPTAGPAGKVGQLRDFVATWRPDVIVSLQAFPNLLCIALRLSMRAKTRPMVVISERNLVSLGVRGAPLKHRVKVWVCRRLYRFSDAVVAISHPVAGELVSGFGVAPEKCAVVPNPATAKVRPRTSSKQRGEGPVELVHAGRLVHQKRPLLVIDTAAELQRRGVPAVVSVFGDGPLLAAVTQHAGARGVELRHHGWVEDWFNHCGGNAVLLLTSSREGFGNVLVEAAAVGVPSVAASEALGVADALVPGITGELARSGAPADFADAVERAARLDVSGIDRWLQRFSMQESGLTLEHFIKARLESRRHGGRPSPAHPTLSADGSSGAQPITLRSAG